MLCTRVCFSVHVWFSKIQGLIFFCCFCLLNFFSRFLWACSSKYTRKDMTDTMKHFEQQTSSTLCSVLYLVHPKSSSIGLFQSCDRLKSDTSAAQKKKKKKTHLGQVFQSVMSFETQHFFFSLTRRQKFKNVMYSNKPRNNSHRLILKYGQLKLALVKKKKDSSVDFEIFVFIHIWSFLSHPCNF